MTIRDAIRRVMLVASLLALGTLSACGESEGAPIRATLADGQVLYGTLRTTTLYLDGAMGRVAVPLTHVGEVVPVEGDQLDAAEGHVKIWLRNGSELVGRWDEPELGMGIDVGGDQVVVDLPVNDLQRVQTQGDEEWPREKVYRVRTTHGDDFLVDAERSRIVIENALGMFSPHLSECRSVTPIDDPAGEWRIELETGTVLIGSLADDELTLALPLGPEEVTVPLAILDSMEQQSWYFADAEERRVDREIARSESFAAPSVVPRSGREPASGGGISSWMAWEGGADELAAEVAPAEEATGMSAGEPTPEPEADEASGEGWFKRDALEKTKRATD